VTACGTGPAAARPAVSVTAEPTAPALASPSSRVAGVPRSVLAAQYLAIARPANKRLDRDFDGLEDASRDDLPAAAADLRDAAATELAFDRQLLRLELPPAEETIARLMVSANESRARLSERAAASPTLVDLDRFLARLTAANAPVEEAVIVIRGQLGLPPPDTS
jgi:hypothetical protein